LKFVAPEEVDMDEEERLDALEMAINNELRERAFYLNHAGRTKNLLGRAMFEQLADEELEHCTRLKQIRDEWRKQTRWPETVPLTIKNTVVRDIFLRTVQEAGKKPESDGDDLDAIRAGVEFEAKGARLYAKLRDALSVPLEREFFNLLSTIEHEHYLSLVAALEYFAEPDSRP
jgi:rubrerythrin